MANAFQPLLWQAEADTELHLPQQWGKRRYSTVKNLHRISVFSRSSTGTKFMEKFLTQKLGNRKGTEEPNSVLCKQPINGRVISSHHLVQNCHYSDALLATSVTLPLGIKRWGLLVIGRNGQCKCLRGQRPKARQYTVSHLPANVPSSSSRSRWRSKVTPSYSGSKKGSKSSRFRRMYSTVFDLRSMWQRSPLSPYNWSAKARNRQFLKMSKNTLCGNHEFMVIGLLQINDSIILSKMQKPKSIG